MRIKLVKPLLKIKPKLRDLIFLGLLLLGPNLFAQTDSSENLHQEQPQDRPQEKEQIQEEHDTKNLDKLLINYNKDQEKVLKDAAVINKKDETDVSEKELGVNQHPKPDYDEEPALKKADLSFFDSKSHFNKNKNLHKTKYYDALKVTLEPLQKMSEKELIAVLKDNTKDSAAAVYIVQYPKLTLFTVRLIKDPEALPNLGRILDRDEQLIQFAGIMVATILVAFLLKRFMRREGRTVLKALSLWFLRFFIISTLRVGLIMYFYGSELSPLFKIATNTFF